MLTLVRTTTKEQPLKHRRPDHGLPENSTSHGDSRSIEAKWPYLGGEGKDLVSAPERIGKGAKGGKGRVVEMSGDGGKI
jgi:hypothetical protein